MRYSVTNTAEHGDYTRGPRIVNEQTRAEMKKMLDEIQSGSSPSSWIAENQDRTGHGSTQLRLATRAHQIEQVGTRCGRT